MKGFILFLLFISLSFSKKTPQEEVDEIGRQMLQNLAKLAIRNHKYSFEEAKEFLLEVNPGLKPTISNQIFEAAYMIEMMQRMKKEL